MRLRRIPFWIAVAVAGLALFLNGAASAAGGLESSAAATTVLSDAGANFAVSAIESRLFNDATDGKWDEHSLFTAAQIASGETTDAELLAAALDFAALVADLREKLTALQPAEQRAATVLAFLHSRLLHGGYDLQATELPHVLASGRFNCVSATVLYNCLAAEAGLAVRALRMPQHTCSLLLDGERRIRIEATCLDWFEAHQPLRTHNFSTPDATSSGETGDDGVTITDVALVAMIYYNRGVEALRQHNFKQAIALNRLALALDPDNSDARGNLLTAINKLALELTGQKQFAEASALVELGLTIEPNHAPLRQNRAFIDRARQQAATTTGGPDGMPSEPR